MRAPRTLFTGSQWRGSGTAPRRTDDRGAALVEFALIAPFLVLLLFSVIDFGSVYFDRLAIREGTQSAARSLAVAQFGTDSSCVPQGGTWTADTRNMLCKTKTAIQVDDKTRIRVKIVLPDSGGFAKGNTAKLCTQTSVVSVSGFYTTVFANQAVQTVSVVRIEQNGSLVAASETALPGSSWAFCP